MEECCDICGNIGITDALVTCSQCKICSEHMYCMRKILEKFPDFWRCEECESGSKSKPLPSSHTAGPSKLTTNPVTVSKGTADHTKLFGGSRISATNWEKKVAIGKTKYICANEAIKLSCGEKKSFGPSKFASHPKPPQPKSRLNIAGASPARPRPEPMKFPSTKPGNMDITERQRQQSKQHTQAKKSLWSSLQPSQMPVNNNLQKHAEVKLPQPKAKSLMMKPPASYALPVTTSGRNKCMTTEVRTCDAENVNNNFLPKFDDLWMGSFSIQDELTHRKQNYEIQALPPSTVRRKVHEFSKQMPKVLHFQLVPVKKYWTSFFQVGCPDRRDIGLYFLPRHRVRCEDYFSLLDSISTKNFALRKQIADVELLVFTSKLLPVNYQCLEGKYFLWGVFRRLRQNLDTRGLKLYEEANRVHNQVDENEDVDMDIDMIGGVDVGMPEFCAQRKPLTEKCMMSFKEESPTSKVVNLGFRKHY